MDQNADEVIISKSDFGQQYRLYSTIFIPNLIKLIFPASHWWFRIIRLGMRRFLFLFLFSWALGDGFWHLKAGFRLGFCFVGAPIAEETNERVAGLSGETGSGLRLLGTLFNFAFVEIRS